MTEEQIVNAINKARNGVDKYLEIMTMFGLVNVAVDTNFQRKYNAFYRVRQRTAQWYQIYYQHMQSKKGNEVTFSEVLRYFRQHLGRYEPSFSSKFVATHNPIMPIWDSRVLARIGIHAPSYYSHNKFELAETTYQEIVEWYNIFKNSTEGQIIINIFDEIINRATDITDIKKIDFVLWQFES